MIMGWLDLRRGFAPIVVVVVAVALGAGGGSALASPVLGPHWAAMSMPAPTWFHPGDTDDMYEVAAMNDGGTPTSGQITLTDTLPKGVTVIAITGGVDVVNPTRSPGVAISCREASSEKVVTVTCTTSEKVYSDTMIAVKISVDVPSKAALGTPLVNTATISGGGAMTATVSNSTPVTPISQVAPFGISVLNDVIDPEGAPDTQAGSHPYAYTTFLAFNNASVNPSEDCGPAFIVAGRSTPFNTKGCPSQAGGARDVEVTLPPGMVGNPTAVPRCEPRQFLTSGYQGCPADTQVGVVELVFYASEDTQHALVPVYNVQPSPGQPAELGFSVSTVGHVPMLFHTRPLPGGGYALVSLSSQITQFIDVRALALTIWGDPAEESHTPQRYSEAPGHECEAGTDDNCKSNAPLTPFLTLPTSCPGTSLTTEIGADDWQNPLEAPFPISAEAELGTMSGCEALTLTGPGREPSVTVEPSTHQAGVPAGYGVTLKVPQNEEPEGLATPDIKNVEVAMPEGTVISPSAANGLTACTSEQFAQGSETVGNCPASSKIGTVKIVSPLIEAALTGSVYVGEPECSPCTASQAQEGKMVHLLIEARLADPQREGELSQEEREKLRPSVLIKLSGHTRIDPMTGRLTTVFEDNPQLPFSELTLTLEDGPDAPLVNPAGCGPVQAGGTFTPWSGTTPVSVSSPPVSLEDCATPSFSPSLTAGMTTSSQAGAFSGFAVTLTRPDGQQALGGVTITTPPGISGVVNGIPLCGESEANAGTCSSASQIGEVTSIVGPGPKPYTLTGGRAYLTTGYGGGSFGLSIVVPAQAGPYRLAGVNGAGGEGNGSVVIRGSVEVNPTTAALTIKTNQIPTQLDGIPLSIQKVIVNVNRPNFMFNPTDCDAMSVNNTIVSSSGTSVSGSYPFQAVNCAALKFEPKFAVSTSGKTSKADGASLHVSLTFPPSPQGSQANVHLVKVELPKQLPSRLTTLQKACTAAQFESNPAGCPAASVVGHARAITPILPVPLEGPAYFVSHGGEAFPNLIIVLQGYGVTVELVGDTLIKDGITSSTFKTVPDVPVSNFELSLPAGPYSVLAAPSGLCAEPLTLPTEMIGQNGALVRQDTKLAVQGCKAAIRVLGHSVKGVRARIRVSVPFAGTLVASGKGVKRSAKRVAKAGTVTLGVTLSALDRRVLAKHPNQRVKVKVTLRFTSKHGAPLTAHLRLLLK